MANDLHAMKELDAPAGVARQITVLIRDAADAETLCVRISEMAPCNRWQPEECLGLLRAARALASNILTHAGQGEIAVQPLTRRGLQLTASDRGPGIADMALVLKTSAATPGQPGVGRGFDHIRRFADHLTIQSGPDRGTTVTIRYYPREERR